MSFPYYLAILIVFLASVVPGGLDLQTEEDMSQEEANIALITKWINDAVLGADPSIDFALEVLADPFMQHTVGDEFTHIPAAGPIQYFRNIRSYLDDVDVEIRHIVAQDDMLVWHYTIRGIWTKPVYAASGVVEPTNEEIIIEHIHINRMEDGKIAEAWFYARDPIEMAVNRAMIVAEASDD